MREVARANLTRGEIPFLHAFADDTGAIALYERLGFATRWSRRLWLCSAPVPGHATCCWNGETSRPDAPFRPEPADARKEWS